MCVGVRVRACVMGSALKFGVTLLVLQSRVTACEPVQRYLREKGYFPSSRKAKAEKGSVPSLLPAPGTHGTLHAVGG